MVLVMLTVMVMLMDTDTPMLMLDTITAKDLLSLPPSPPLSPPLLLTTDTDMDTGTDMVTVMLMDTDTPMLVTITAKGLLKPSPIMVMVMLLMPTMVTVMVMVTVMATVMLMASKFILLSFLSNYYNGCVYKKFYNLESFDLRSTVSEVQPLAYKKEALVMLSVILCRV
jgi:hypothetical protein